MTMLSGIFLIIISNVVFFAIGKRKFGRRNAAGLEEFNSYEKSVVTGTLESLLTAVAGIAFIIGSVLVIYSLLMAL